MSKKSTAVAVILGIFGFGGFYAAGLKKGLILFVATCIICWVCGQVSPSISMIGNVVSIYMSYKWVKEYNAALPEGADQN